MLRIPLFLLLISFFGSAVAQLPVADPISLHGLLRQDGQPVDGDFDFSVKFYDGPDPLVANATGAALLVDDSPVSLGFFSLLLDPPDVEFVGAKRWAKISVRAGSSSGSYTDLSPLVAITPAPQSLYSLQAETLLGFLPSDFASAAHSHAALKQGQGLLGGDYTASQVRTWSVDFGAGANQAVRGNTLIKVDAGNGLLGGTAGLALGTAPSITIDVGAGDGLEALADSLRVRTGNGLQIVSTAVAVKPGRGVLVDTTGVRASVDGSTIGFDGLDRLSVLPGAAAPHWRNVAIVALQGGDYASPQAALTALASWCTSPSSTEPCLIQLMPGEYPASAPISLRSYVELRGSGAGVSLLTRSNAGSGSPLLQATSACSAAAPCVVADLSMRLTGAGSSALGLSLSAGSLRLERSSLSVTGGSASNSGIAATAGSLQVIDSQILASGTASRAVDLSTTSTVLSRSSLQATGDGRNALRGASSALDSDDSSLTVSGSTSSSYTTIELNGGHWDDRHSSVLGAGSCSTCALLVVLGNGRADLDSTSLRYDLGNSPSSNSVAIINATPNADGRNSLYARNARLQCGGTQCVGLILAGGTADVSGSELTSTVDTLRVLTPATGQQAFARVVHSTIYGGTDSAANVATGGILHLFHNDILGGSVVGAGTRLCASSVSSSGVFRSNTCP